MLLNLRFLKRLKKDLFVVILPVEQSLPLFRDEHLACQRQGKEEDDQDDDSRGHKVSEVGFL